MSITSAVSTHSRPKAAGQSFYNSRVGAMCFNSQPPEGGWAFLHSYPQPLDRFNSQPPEGGWDSANPTPNSPFQVSTHSRPKAAGTTPEQARR